MKVTVITTVLNQATDLAATMQSVFDHARPGLDYVVIDGGSTDGSVDVIREYADRLKHWVSEPDTGVYDAMNKGWALADSDSWVLFLGAGDRLLALPDDGHGDEPSPEVLYGHVLLDGGRYFQARKVFWLKLYNSLHHQALLVPKRLHPEPPFDLSYPRYADYDFNQRLSRAGARFRFEPRLSAYAAAAGLTGATQIDELKRIIRKNYGPFWSGLSVLGFALARTLPLFRALRPVRRGGGRVA